MEASAVLLPLGVVASSLLLAGPTLLASLQPRHARQSEEWRPLLNNDATASAKRQQKLPTSRIFLLPSFLVSLGLYGLSIAILVVSSVASHSSAWRTASHAGFLVSSAYLVLLTATRLVHPASDLSLHYVATLALTTACSLFAHIGPFAQVHNRPTFTVDSLQIAFFCTSTALVLLLLATPSTYRPAWRGAEPHPYQTASPLSRMLFFFIELPMWRFATGPDHGGVSSWIPGRPKKQLDFPSTVPRLPDVLHSRFILDRFRWRGDGGDEGEVRHGRSFAFALEYKLEVAKIVLIALVWVFATFLSPLSMNLLLNYVQDRGRSKYSPYLFVVGLLLGPLISSIALQTSLFLMCQISVRARVVLSHAIFAKVMRMREGGGAEASEDGESNQEDDDGSVAGDTDTATTGRVNNLVGTDIDVITASLETSLQLLAIPVKIVVSLAYLYALLGWSAFIALATILFFTPLSFWVSTRYGAVQERIMRATDRRVTLVNELFGAIRTIKFAAWEKPMSKKIEAVRDSELKAIVRRAWVYSVLMLISTGVPAAVSLATLGAYVFGTHTSLTASVAFTSLSLFGLLREAIISSTYFASAFMRARVSLGRISSLLTDGEELDDSSTASPSNDLMFSDAEFSWRNAASHWRLKLDSLTIPSGKLTIIGGTVGSGKSALLYAILGEMHKVQGEVSMPTNEPIAYAAQSSWLQNRTIRENIVFGERFEKARYETAIREGALEADLNRLNDGDQTMVGERGLSLSGGQKARVALARALYSRASLVLLDDVLSAVDSGTTAHLLKHCFEGTLLKNRTVVLVTHYVELCARLQSCAQVVLLENGAVSKAGKPKDVLGADFAEKPAGDEVTTTEQPETKEKGERAGAEGDGDEEGESTGGLGISFSVYRRYLRQMGGPFFWCPYIVINIAAHLLMLGQGGFVGRWVSAPDKEAREGFYFGIYALLQVGTGVTLTTMYLWLIFGAVRASRRLHSALLSSIFNAPVRFFDKTPLARIINRMSKDMETVDTEIVQSLQPVADYGAQVLLAAIVTTVLLPPFLLPAVVLSIGFYLVGQLYVRNALVARKHVATARSPMLTTLGDTAAGIVTIRAFRRQEAFNEAFQRHTEAYNRMQLYEYALDRWLELRSDTVGALVAFAVGLLALSGSLSSGTIGFLLSTGIEITGRILYVVRAINENTLNFNSAQRVFEYSSDIEQEKSSTARTHPPASWPEDGQITLDNASVRYDETLPNVLKSVSVELPKRTRCGIVGATGCGKSSLTLALLRIIDAHEGGIYVDGRNLADTDIEAIRRRMTLVPQDPVLFSGSVRDNLDPFDDHEDAELWDAIKSTGFYRDGEEHEHGLDAQVASGGSNMSQGQRQLLSLARAIVRRSKVVILDEATASVDSETDERIQRAIKEQFADATLLIVAHRLNTVISLDLVLVMSAGQIVEQGKPVDLLKKEGGAFRKMCEQTGDYGGLLRAAEAAAANEDR